MWNGGSSIYCTDQQPPVLSASSGCQVLMDTGNKSVACSSAHLLFGLFTQDAFVRICKHLQEYTYDAERNARETIVYAYPCHQPYSTPNTIGPRGTSWRVTTSGVHASKAFLERYSRHIGFSYIILLHRVFLMFGLHRVFLVSARMRKETLEKRLYTRTHATNHIAHPIPVSYTHLTLPTNLRV